MNAAIWDPGLQNERTYFAWSRSALSILGCGLLTARLAAHWHWVSAIATVVLAGLLYGALHRASRKRYARASSALAEGQPLPDGRQGAVLMACLLVLGLLAIILTLARPLGTSGTA